MFIFSIFTCPKHKDRIKALEDTCIPTKLPEDCSMYYVYGGSGKKFSTKGRDLYVPCHESYKHLLEKTYETIRYALNFDFEYLIKLDSDIYIPSFDKLVSKIRTLKAGGVSFATTKADRIVGEDGKSVTNPGEKARKWHYPKVKKSDRLPYTGYFPVKWAQGHCYILNKNNCEILAKELAKKEYELSSFDVTKKWLYEDMAISTILLNRGVKLMEIGPLVEHLTLDNKGLTSKEIKDRHIRDLYLF